MKTYAGSLYFELPGDWEDESQYIYRESASDIEIRVEYSPVDVQATPEQLIDPMIKQLQKLGPLDNLQRSKTKVRNHDAATLSVACKREGDEDAILMQVLVYKAWPTQAVTLSAFASPEQASRLTDLWRTLLASLKTVEIQ